MKSIKEKVSPYIDGMSYLGAGLTSPLSTDHVRKSFRKRGKGKAVDRVRERAGKALEIRGGQVKEIKHAIRDARVGQIKVAGKTQTMEQAKKEAVVMVNGKRFSRYGAKRPRPTISGVDVVQVLAEADPLIFRTDSEAVKIVEIVASNKAIKK